MLSEAPYMPIRTSPIVLLILAVSVIRVIGGNLLCVHERL